MGEREREGPPHGEVEHVIVCACVRAGGCVCVRACVHACVQACAGRLCVFASACSFCPASCFLMQHRTVSPGLLGDLVMFFFFFLSSQETRTNCCAVAIGVGRFVFPPLSSLVPPHRQLP